MFMLVKGIEIVFLLMVVAYQIYLITSFIDSIKKKKADENYKDKKLN
jgi:Na+-transporting methylmalonyl-CoA/oxaloacetate decarboxylase gamma subunit